MKKITIIGCGLIGGSFAALVKKYQPTIEVIGIGRREAPLQAAKEQGFIDEYAINMSDAAIASSDLVIIASPTSTVLPIIKELTNRITSSRTIMEFSSVKSFLNDPIIESSHHNIIAAHPMGGLDVQGLEHASATVLEHCPMIVFEEKNPIHTFFNACSFNLIHCPSYDIHDEWMANISHGPYLVASLLPSILSKKNDNEKTALQNVSAGGFRDTTRVCNSPVEWGLDIIKGNKDKLIQLIDELTLTLNDVKSHILAGDNDALKTWLETAKNTRSKIAKK